MGWDRRLPDSVLAPAPIVMGRWVLAAGLAVSASVLLFWLYASGRVSGLNMWVVTGLPLMSWLFAFGARAYVYGGALSHQQFLEEQAQIAQQSWQDWSHRFLAVHACYVLLPDRVSASVLTQGSVNLPPRTGEARRITALSQREEPALAGLELLFPVLVPSLLALPAAHELRVTLLSDAEPEQYEALRGAWQRHWTSAIRRPPPSSVTITSELSYQWIDETLKTASASLELILVLQAQGGSAYSDGLAALLLCPDKLAAEWGLPVQGGMLRPMPLDITTLESELALFFQTQADARQATGLLADNAGWQPLAGKIVAASGANGASLKVEQQWIQERLCGLPGPFSHWLTAALSVQVVQHQQSPLLVLVQERAQHWISTVTKGEHA